MVAQEGTPALPAWPRAMPFVQMPLDAALGHTDSELEQFPANALRAPKPILGGHASYEIDDVRRDASGRRLRRSRLPAPQQAKPFAVPTQDGLRLNQQQRVLPPRKRGREQRHRSALVPPEDRSSHLPRHHDELLAQQGVLSHLLRARSQQISRKPPCDRTRPWTQGFTDRFRGPFAKRPQPANGAPSEHATDLARDVPEFQAHVMLEIFNDPAPEERGSHNTC